LVFFLFFFFNRVRCVVIYFDDTEEYKELRLPIGESEHSAICHHGGTTRGFLRSVVCAPALV
jgi:hypothetical protein